MGCDQSPASPTWPPQLSRKSEVVSLGWVSGLVHFPSQVCVGNQQALDLDEEILYLVWIAWRETMSRFSYDPDPTYGGF